jgi:hypothetical protein
MTLRTVLLDLIAFTARVVVVSGVLYMTASNFDDTEATVIGAVALYDAGAMGLKKLAKKEE